jgi:hypothetical protein
VSIMVRNWDWVGVRLFSAKTHESPVRNRRSTRRGAKRPNGSIDRGEVTGCREQSTSCKTTNAQFQRS